LVKFAANLNVFLNTANTDLTDFADTKA